MKCFIEIKKLLIFWADLEVALYFLTFSSHRFFSIWRCFNLDSHRHVKGILLALLSQTLVTLLGNRQLDTGTLGQADVGLVALPDHEDVRHASGEAVTVGILDVDNVEGSRMSLPVNQKSGWLARGLMGSKSGSTLTCA